MTTGSERIIRDDIRAMSAYPVPSAAGLIKLDAMENPYPLPAALRRAVAEDLAACEMNRYPDPTAPALKSCLREAMGIPQDMDILLGNGSDEIIQMVVQACARPGAVVMAPVPTFVMYRNYATIAGVRFVGVPLKGDFALDVEAFLSEIRAHRPAVVFLSHPNNPTGNLFSTEAMLSILDAAPGLVVIDEAYQPFAQTSWLDKLPGFPNVILLRTMSKLGLAGIRLGYAVGRPDWLSEIDKVRSPYNVNALTQCAAERILRSHEVLDAQAADIRASRDLLSARLAAIPGLTPFPSSANFILVRVPDAPLLFSGLCKRGVLIKNLHGAHPLLEHCVRVTVGTPVENSSLLESIAAVLTAVPNGATVRDRVV